MNARTLSIVVFGITLAAVMLAHGEVGSPSADIVAVLSDPELAGVLRDTLERNPEIAAAEARLEAERQIAPQARVLPDPEVQLTAYLMPPQTRVGALRAMAMVSQRLPGAGKRGLREQSALQFATAAAAEVEARRLRLITDARRLYHEAGYLDAAFAVLEADRVTLAHFEELARARYASGVGLQQDVVSIQAEITKIDGRFADIRARRASVLAAINALRDRPGAGLDPRPPTRTRLPLAGWETLRERALESRPELSAVDALILRAEAEADIAGKRGAPDFNIGLVYGFVEPRTDANPPDNGEDDLGVTGGITIPLWRDNLRAGVEEASQRRLAAQEQRRAVVASIDRELQELRGRIPEVERQVDLFEGPLRIQSEQVLRSAEAAYAAGRIDGLALLDAERTLLDVGLAAQRSRADLAIALAELEGTIAGPLAVHDKGEGQ
jgi:outer membrane protein, heavy metal efflux system